MTYHSEDDHFRGYLEKESEYLEFFSNPGEEVILRQIEIGFPFRDYEHFAGVVGKFNPWTALLKDPIPIEELTREALRRACSESPYIDQGRTIC